jgi:hypothetical protein
LFNAVVSKEIDMEEALRRSGDPQELTQMMGAPAGVR